MAKPREIVADRLRQRFFSGLHLGEIVPGSRLPSVRELADELGIDRRIVLAAYRDLEHEGLVELRQRSGIYFAPGAERSIRDPARGADWAIDVALRALGMGIPAPMLADRFRSYLQARRLRACCLECNDDQLTSLRAELAEDYGFVVDGLDVTEAIAETNPRSELLNADLIVTTRFHASEAQELAARVGRPWIAVSLRTDVFAEIARLVPSEPVYFFVSDPRYADKLRRIFSAEVEGASNFHPVVVGRDGREAIAPRAVAYVTRAARDSVTAASSPLRIVHESKVFSLESSRELIAFIVRANLAAGTSDVR